ESALARLTRYQTRRDQYRRVRRVGAAGDRGDGDVAVAEVELLAFDADTRIGCLVIGRIELRVELVVHIAKHYPGLRTFRSRGRRLDRAHVQLERVREQRLRRARAAPQALGLGIGANQGDLVVVPAGQLQIVDRALIDREEAAGRAIFRRHVGDGC